MKVLLRSDVATLGKKGDLVSVADGYARNYLVPQGLAVRASRGAEKQAEEMKRARVTRDARDLDAARELAGRLTGKNILIPARAGEGGKLFGSITSSEVVAAVQEVVAAVQQDTGIELDRRKLELDEPIKTLGVHLVPFRLHPNVDLTLTIEVVAEA